jgi:hypothetical protein
MLVEKLWCMWCWLRNCDVRDDSFSTSITYITVSQPASHTLQFLNQHHIHYSFSTSITYITVSQPASHTLQFWCWLRNCNVCDAGWETVMYVMLVEKLWCTWCWLRNCNVCDAGWETVMYQHHIHYSFSASITYITVSQPASHTLQFLNQHHIHYSFSACDVCDAGWETVMYVMLAEKLWCMWCWLRNCNVCDAGWETVMYVMLVEKLWCT